MGTLDKAAQNKFHLKLKNLCEKHFIFAQGSKTKKKKKS